MVGACDGIVMVAIAALLPADSPRLAGEDPVHIQDLAEVEAEVPPIVVHRPTMRVVDGMHRLRAAELCGHDTIGVRFVDDDERDLFVVGLRLNSAHGLPLTRCDRIAAATRVTRSHPEWSDRMIGELTGLSAKTVAAVRLRSTEEIPRLNVRMGRDGRERPVSTAEGRRVAGELMTRRPDASVREIARASGISIGTAQDVRNRLRRGEDPVPDDRRRRGHMQVVPARPRPETTQATMDGLLRQLKNDPSLRFSAVGRAILRLLDAHSISAAAWAELADAVPAHSADAVAAIAHSCARSWSQFADQLSRRTATTG